MLGEALDAYADEDFAFLAPLEAVRSLARPAVQGRTFRCGRAPTRMAP